MKSRVIIVSVIILVSVILSVFFLIPNSSIESRFNNMIEKLQKTEIIIVKESNNAIHNEIDKYYIIKEIEDRKDIKKIIDLISTGKPHNNLVAGVKPQYLLEFRNKNDSVILLTGFPGISLNGIAVSLSEETNDKILEYLN